MNPIPTPLSDKAAELNDLTAMYVRSAELERMLAKRIIEVCDLSMKNYRQEQTIADLTAKCEKLEGMKKDGMKGDCPHCDKKEGSMKGEMQKTAVFSGLPERGYPITPVSLNGLSEL